MGADYHSKPKYQQQDDAILDQAAPVQNTWYVVLAFTGVQTKITDICAAIQVANETIQLEVTVNGNVFESNDALVAAIPTHYSHHIDPTAGNYLMADAFAHGVRLEGDNVQVRIRKTTALGAGNLQCKVSHQLDP